MERHLPDNIVTLLRAWSVELGFQQLGITTPDPGMAGARLREWLALGHQGAMAWMGEHVDLRTDARLLQAGTIRVICVRMDYWRSDAWPAAELAAQGDRAWISRYALGRDYHKIMRPRLQQLATRLTERIGPFGYRVFVDSGPVMEKPLAQQAGLGWQGKHTNLINRSAGSWFFLGEILTDLPLPADEAATDHCGSCHACIDVCPTRAIIAPYVLDARRCISYLTIENRGPIPLEFRVAIGNRIFGCDDCQLYCPWNKFARPSTLPDLAPRHGLDRASLVDLFLWDEARWDQQTRGSPIRRAGYIGWLRNLAVALGNAPDDPTVRQALEFRSGHESELVREHVRWALGRHERFERRE